jgi:hypothetical protein
MKMAVGRTLARPVTTLYFTWQAFFPLTALGLLGVARVTMCSYSPAVHLAKAA